jgi:hypothetical protein
VKQFYGLIDEGFGLRSPWFAEVSWQRRTAAFQRNGLTGLLNERPADWALIAESTDFLATIVTDFGRLPFAGTFEILGEQHWNGSPAMT